MNFLTSSVILLFFLHGKSFHKCLGVHSHLWKKLPKLFCFSKKWPQVMTPESLQSGLKTTILKTANKSEGGSWKEERLPVRCSPLLSSEPPTGPPNVVLHLGRFREGRGTCGMKTRTCLYSHITMWSTVNIKASIVASSKHFLCGFTVCVAILQTQLLAAWLLFKATKKKPSTRIPSWPKNPDNQCHEMAE